MPAKSKKQQQAAGMALAAKRGEISPSKLKGSAKQMYKSMTAKQLEEYAGTKTKGLPTRVKKKKRIPKPEKLKRQKLKKKQKRTSPPGFVPFDHREPKTGKVRAGGMKSLIRQKVKEL